MLSPPPPDQSLPPAAADPSVPAAPASEPSVAASPMTDASEPIVRPTPRVRRLVVFTGRIP